MPQRGNEGAAMKSRSIPPSSFCSFSQTLTAGVLKMIPQRMLCTFLILIVASTLPVKHMMALTRTIAPDEAARMVQGVHASVTYQQHKQTQDSPPQDISAGMAPVLAAIKNGVIAGIDTVSLKALYDNAEVNAHYIANLPPEEQFDKSVDFTYSLASSLLDPKALIKLGLDVIKFEVRAYSDSTDSGKQLSRNEIIATLQPAYFQVQINNFYLTQMAEAHDIGTANQYFAQNFDQIARGDLGVSVADNATTVLNADLTLPDYFRTHANADGSLTVDIDGLKSVYSDQAQALGQASSQTVDLAQFVDSAQHQLMLSNASLRDILNSVPQDTQMEVQALYQANKQVIATATGGINLASTLAAFFDPQTSKEISVFGNAAIQFASAVNEFGLGNLTLANSISTANGVAGAALGVYSLLQGGPSQDQAIQKALAALSNQIKQLRTEMNARFDIIDKSLNILYTTINTDFNEVIADLDQLILQLSDLQRDLNRFERNFYELEIAGFLKDLDSGVTGCIAFEQTYGRPMDFPTFATCENTFYGWATQYAQTLATLPEDRPYDDAHVYDELSQPSDNKDLNYFADSANINYFNAYPYQRFGLSTLWPALLPNPSVWEISAQSHLQLAKENPWYDAGLSASRIADVISTGSAVQSALQAIIAPDGNGAHPLFNSLVANYSSKVTEQSNELAGVEARIDSTDIQTEISKKLATNLDGCGNRHLDVASPSNTFSNVDGTFLIAEFLLSNNRSGFGQVATCVDLGWGDYYYVGNILYAHLWIYLTASYQGTEVSSIYLKTDNTDPATDQWLNYFWGILVYNWPAVKAGFEQGPVFEAYPCVLHGGVKTCDPNYEPFREGVLRLVDLDGLYQETLYCNIISDFSNLTSEGLAIQATATELAGTKAIFGKYLLIGTPHSLRNSDYLRSLMSGIVDLPGRTSDGNDEIVTNIYGPAVMGLTGARDYMTACQSSVVVNQGPPKIDLANIVGVRLSDVQKTLSDILAQLDNHNLAEYDDTLNSTLQTLNSFETAKLANSVATPTGSNITVQSQQDVSVTYSQVSKAGVTLTTPRNSGTAFAQSDYVLTPLLSYGVETSASYAGPIVTCFLARSVNDAQLFSALVVLHTEGSTLVDRTSSRDFATRTVCAKTDSLSPFTVALAQSAPPQSLLTVSKTGSGTITSSGGEINCGSSCSFSYTRGSVIPLSATADQGWTFTNWVGCDSSDGSNCTVKMNNNRNIIATFAQTGANSYSDTFGDSSINPFWMLTQQNGTVSLSTDQDHTSGGVQSLSFSSGNGQSQSSVSHTFATPQTGDFSVWFYDVAPGQQTKYEQIFLYNSITTDSASIGTQDFDAYCYEAQLYNYNSGMRQGPNANCGIYPQISTTNVLRTAGWHQFHISVGASAIILSIDGKPVFSTAGSYSYDTVTLFESGPDSGTVSYWDDFCSGSCQSTSAALQFVPVTPCRLVDTRLTGGPIQGGKSRDFAVPQEGGCKIPATAAAYSLNVTVVPQKTLGYLTVWPTGKHQPYISTLNSYDGRVKANAAVVPAGDNGAVSIYVSDTAHVVLDINGYFAPVSDSTLAFYPLKPCRVADTRNPLGDLGGPYLTGGEARDFPVLEAASCNIPSSAQAYSLNLTAVPRGPLGYLTAWPTGQTQPYVSTLNSYSGQVVANAAIVPAGTSGKISTFASNDTDLVIDVNGYFAPPSSVPNGLSLYALDPCRVLDTRNTIGPISTLSVNVMDSSCGVPGAAQAFVLNATVVPPGPLGYLTMWPDGEATPLVSTLNASDGAVTSNMAIVPTPNGWIDNFASDPTQLILDISSYFAP
jgi:Divergent InlB B-repeat domain